MKSPIDDKLPYVPRVWSLIPQNGSVVVGSESNVYCIKQARLWYRLKKKQTREGALTPEQRRQRQLLLSQLIYEMDEKPIYYAGYQDVLSGLKEPEEIMGASYLRSYLIAIICTSLASKSDLDFYGKCTGYLGICRCDLDS